MCGIVIAFCLYPYRFAYLRFLHFAHNGQLRGDRSLLSDDHFVWSPVAPRRNAGVPAELCLCLSVHCAHDVGAKCAGEGLVHHPSAGVQWIWCNQYLDCGSLHSVPAGTPTTKVVSYMGQPVPVLDNMVVDIIRFGSCT